MKGAFIFQRHAFVLHSCPGFWATIRTDVESKSADARTQIQPLQPANVGEDSLLQRFSLDVNTFIHQVARLVP